GCGASNCVDHEFTYRDNDRLGYLRVPNIADGVRPQWPRRGSLGGIRCAEALSPRAIITSGTRSRRCTTKPICSKFGPWWLDSRLKRYIKQLLACTDRFEIAV